MDKKIKKAIKETVKTISVKEVMRKAKKVCSKKKRVVFDDGLDEYRNDE